MNWLCRKEIIDLTPLTAISGMAGGSGVNQEDINTTPQRPIQFRDIQTNKNSREPFNKIPKKKQSSFFLKEDPNKKR